MKPALVIAYCPRCRWLARATWIAQELLTTFSEELGEVVLRPAETGRFDLILAGEAIFSRQIVGRFPEPKELKQIIRDRIAPGKDLGHSDN